MEERAEGRTETLCPSERDAFEDPAFELRPRLAIEYDETRPRRLVDALGREDSSASRRGASTSADRFLRGRAAGLDVIAESVSRN